MGFADHAYPWPWAGIAMVCPWSIVGECHGLGFPWAVLTVDWAWLATVWARRVLCIRFSGQATCWPWGVLHIGLHVHVPVWPWAGLAIGYHGLRMGCAEHGLACVRAWLSMGWNVHRLG
jgi:hypothetical protein